MNTIDIHVPDLVNYKVKYYMNTTSSKKYIQGQRCSGFPRYAEKDPVGY